MCVCPNLIHVVLKRQNMKRVALFIGTVLRLAYINLEQMNSLFNVLLLMYDHTDCGKVMKFFFH